MVTEVRNPENTDVRRRGEAWLDRTSTPTGAILLNGAAMAAVLFHVLVDFHIGLYGATSEVMTPARPRTRSG